MPYIIEYDVAAIIISLAVMFSFFRKRVISTKLTTSFMILVAAIFLSTVFDIITTYIIKSPYKLSLGLDYIFVLGYFLITNTIPVCFYFCILISRKEKIDIKKELLMAIPWAISMILILLTPLCRTIFYFDQNRQYLNGKCLFILYSIASFYIVLAIINVVVHKKDFLLIQRASIYFYGSATLAAVVYQAIFPTVLVTCFFMSISSMMIFLSIVNPGNFIDKEMDVLNTDAFIEVATEYTVTKPSFRVLGIQIIGLKYLNDTISLDTKSELLERVSMLLKSACEKYNIYRISETRVIVLIPDDDAVQNKIIERIHVVFSDSIRLGDFKISLSDRIAILHYPTDADSVNDIESLIHSALDTIIDAEPGTVVHVERGMLDRKQRELQILQIMKTAIRRGDFYVVYQPIYSLKDGRFTTAEALIRLENDILGDISPEEFIPIAEKNGMILQIGEFVFETVCRFILHQKIWEKGIEYIHVNLSVIQCMQEKLADQLFGIMDMYNLDYRYINLEVTETAAVVSSDTLMTNMKRLIERNMNFSLDDFGTGFSNIASLIKYPFHTIKLDKYMVWDAMHNIKAEKIMRNIIDMVKLLEMEIVAEGAETTEQVDRLKEMGCDFVQGFYYSKPITRNEFIDLINDNNGRWE